MRTIGSSLVIAVLVSSSSQLGGIAVAADPGAEGALVPRSYPTEATEHWSLRSEAMESTYDISVALPMGYAADPEARFPALFVLDGNWMFGTATMHARFMVYGQEIRDLFVVSIGTPFEEGPAAAIRRRVYQFSPANEWPLTDPFGKTIRQTCTEQFKIEISECVGGAPRFLEFITNELIPLLTERYRIDTEDLGLFGVSAGGFFTAWTVFQPSSPFAKYIIASPAMAYGDGEVLRLENRWAADHDDLAAQVYMAAGNRELNLAFEEGVGKIVSGMAELSGMLATRNYPSLRITTNMHPGLGHVGAAAPTLVMGLRELYGR